MTTAFDRLIEAFRADGPIRGKYYRARCPIHEDSNPSLEIWRSGKQVVFTCWICNPPGSSREVHKDCTIRMLKAVGLGWKDLIGEDCMTTAFHVGRITATYDYTDEAGELLYQTVRREPGRDGRKKDFSQRRPDPENPGKWLWNLEGCRRVIYRLPEVLAHPIYGDPILVVAGEKDADAAWKIGWAATTNVCGERSPWFPEYSQSLAGRDVCVIPDNDSVGWQHAGSVAWSLGQHGCRVRLLRLPVDAEGADLSDWIAARNGDTKEQIAHALGGMVGLAPIIWRGTPGVAF